MAKRYHRIYILDGDEWKFCPSCEEDKPLTAYYDYRQWGGVLKPHCKTCENERNKAARKRKLYGDVKDHLEAIRKMDKTRRFLATLSMYEAGKLDKTQFGNVLRNIEF